MERLLLLVAIAAGLTVAVCAGRRWLLRRAARRSEGDPVLATLRPGVPAIVYFTSPNCAPCQFQQKPALARLQADLGDGLQVIEVDALAQTEAAARWGVLSVPATFVLDRTGHPRDVNFGVAGVDKLKAQLQRV
jgi:thioredoxin 1